MVSDAETAHGRRRPGSDTEAQVLLLSRRRCPVCYFVGLELGERRGQIAHLDRNPGNSALDNLCFMCLDHHDVYDGKTSQSKGYSEKEVREYRDRLYAAMGELAFPEEAGETREPTTMNMELYARRLAVYKVLSTFLAGILRDAAVNDDQLRDLWSGVDEVPFLFDQGMWQYCGEVHRKGVLLMSLRARLERLDVGVERDQAADGEARLLEWFAQEVVDLRARFVPYMRPAGTGNA